MGFGFAGAMAGLGGGLQKWAEEQQRLANDMVKMEKQEEMRREGMEWNKANGVGRGSGGGSGGGSGEGASGGALTGKEIDDLPKFYNSAFPEDDTGAADPRPTFGQVAAWIEANRKPGESLAGVSERARQAWSVREVETTTEKDRAALSPARLLGGGSTYEDTTVDRVGGFDAATAPPPAGGDAPPAASGPSAAQAQAALEEARAVIAKGADPEKVKQRLRENGIDPAGL